MTDQWLATGEFLYQRRKGKQMTQADVQSAGGPSTAIQRQVENGTYTSSMQRTVRRGYEDALELPRGTIDRLLAGEDLSDGDVPVTPGGNDEPEFELLTRVREDLTDDEMETLMKESEPYLQMLIRDIKNRRG